MPNDLKLDNRLHSTFDPQSPRALANREALQAFLASIQDEEKKIRARKKFLRAERESSASASRALKSKTVNYASVVCPTLARNVDLLPWLAAPGYVKKPQDSSTYGASRTLAS